MYYRLPRYFGFNNDNVTFIFLSSTSTCNILKRFEDADVIPQLPIEVD